ncbi:hypothetical protein S40293_02243 [Stachybotrys chartarum IBT 40293]|nr:hypothetical protein S40293_02243 [Stachybotrys chartarum IBT 40293]
MYRTTTRVALRPALHGLRTTTARAAQRRLASTSSPADKPRSWKSSALRWGLAGAALYYYNTSNVFAAEPLRLDQTLKAPATFADEDLPTVDAIVEEKRKQLKSKVEKKPEPIASEKSTVATESAATAPKQPASSDSGTPGAESATTAISPEAMEEEAGQQGAFNPETGEINWDCPCLGGMANGPCGEEFKTAFSCFIYSEEEPKGMDCIDKFQGMQECFRKYPDVYGGELLDDELEEDAEVPPEGTLVAKDDAIATDSTAEVPSNATAETKASAPTSPETSSLPAAQAEGAAPVWADATSDNKDPEKRAPLPGDVQKEEEEKDAHGEPVKLVVTRD